MLGICDNLKSVVLYFPDGVGCYLNRIFVLVVKSNALS